MKAVPGRKTDVRDAEWLTDLLRHGLLKASFIPDRAQRELRELVPYSKTLIEDRSRLVTRIQKVLEGANIKLGDVASDVMGMSGRAMLKELQQATTDAAQMAGLALFNLRTKKPLLEQVLNGSIGEHQRFMLQSQIRLAESMEQELAALDHEVKERLRPFGGCWTCLTRFQAWDVARLRPGDSGRWGGVMFV